MKNPIAPLLRSEALLCPSRRLFLAGAGAFVAWASLPRFAHAAGRDPRLVVVILRGALDGLAVVPPVGDPDYPALRTDLAVGLPAAPGLALGSFFALNAAMPKLHDQYLAGTATIVHAVATPYRDRSHFDGQDVLENGTPSPMGSDTGWLNRAVAALPAGERVEPRPGLAVSATVPLILRGAAPVVSWTPPDFNPPASDTVARLMDLYTHTDPALSKVLAAGTDIAALAGNGDRMGGGGLAESFRRLADGSARLLADDAGPRIAAISYDGWDTHANEGASGKGRLAGLLAALDGAFDALRITLAPVWNDTVVIAVTEFGRTAAENGTEGTDHGTGTVAFLLGGAVKGGRVVADWPGLKVLQLYEQRDLAPTTDLRAVLKGVLRDHLGLSETVLADSVFPGSRAVNPMDGLLRS